MPCCQRLMYSNIPVITLNWVLHVENTSGLPHCLSPTQVIQTSLKQYLLTKLTNDYCVKFDSINIFWQIIGIYLFKLYITCNQLCFKSWYLECRNIDRMANGVSGSFEKGCEYSLCKIVKRRLGRGVLNHVLLREVWYFGCRNVRSGRAHYEKDREMVVRVIKVIGY